MSKISHEGNPIILMAEAQTIGGYPRIARICAADIPLLAQTRPGVKIRFNEISEEESAGRCKELSRSLKRLKNGIGMQS